MVTVDIKHVLTTNVTEENYFWTYKMSFQKKIRIVCDTYIGTP